MFKRFSSEKKCIPFEADQKPKILCTPPIHLHLLPGDIGSNPTSKISINLQQWRIYGVSDIHGKINKHLREVHLAPSCFGLSPICADPNVGIATFRALYSPWLLQAVIRTILPAKKLVMMNHLLEKSIKVSRRSIRIVNRVECFKYIQAYTL